jgi:ABC-type transport system substrate-binding protein
MDPQLQKFYRQYMQQFSHLSFPPGELLKQEDVQKSLETRFFNNRNLANVPIPYQTRTLDRIMQLIEGAVKNPEDEVGQLEATDILSSRVILETPDDTFVWSLMDPFTYTAVICLHTSIQS